MTNDEKKLIIRLEQIEEFKAKLEALFDHSELDRKVAALEALVTEGDNPTAAIDKFNEIVAFLANITNTQTLDGIVSGINDSIAAKYTKPEGGIPKTDLADGVQASLDKADTAIQDISGKVDKVEGKGLSTNDYDNDAKAKVDELAYATNADIDALFETE